MRVAIARGSSLLHARGDHHRRWRLAPLQGVGALGLCLLLACSGDPAKSDPTADVGVGDAVGTDGTGDVTASDGAVGVATDALAQADGAGPLDGAGQVDAATTGCSACTGAAPLCDPDTGKCVGCILPSDCSGLGARCLAGVCRPPIPCTNDAGCALAGGVCDGTGCIGCKDDAGCKDGRVCKAGHCVPTPKDCAGPGDCGAGSQCNAAAGQCAQCLGDADCDLKQHCAAGLCLPDVCEAGQSQCRAGAPTQRRVCTDNGSGFVQVDCPITAVCEQGVCVKSACVFGNVACDGTKRVVCSDSGLFEYATEDCAEKAMGCDNGACKPWICEPGTAFCQKGGVAKCDVTGTKWNSEGCFGGQLCIDGQCTYAVCKPGELLCEGDSLVQCLGGVKTAEVADCKASGQVCEAGVCAKPVCQPGALTCEGQEVLTCSLKGTHWTHVKFCAAPTPYCTEGKCIHKVCLKGQKTCDGDAILTCKDDELGYDSVSCPQGQLCGAGFKCVTTTCQVPGTWSDNVQKVSSLASASLAQSCDLNGDGKLDNALASVIALLGNIDGELATAIGDGSLLVLFHAPDWTTDGKLFGLGVHSGALDPANKGCSLVSPSANCSYRVSAKGLNLAAPTTGPCPSLNVLDKSAVSSGQLLGKGTAGNLTLPLALFGTKVDLPLKMVQIHGAVTDAKSWKTTSDGKLCGAVVKADLDKAIDAIPDAVFVQMGLDKATVKGLLTSLLKPDIDTDGNGTPDAISAAFKMGTVAGKITGVTQ